MDLINIAYDLGGRTAFAMCAAISALACLIYLLGGTTTAFFICPIVFCGMAIKLHLDAR